MATMEPRSESRGDTPSSVFFTANCSPQRSRSISAAETYKYGHKYWAANVPQWSRTVNAAETLIRLREGAPVLAAMEPRHENRGNRPSAYMYGQTTLWPQWSRGV